MSESTFPLSENIPVIYPRHHRSLLCRPFPSFLFGESWSYSATCYDQRSQETPKKLKQKSKIIFHFIYLLETNCNLLRKRKKCKNILRKHLSS